MFIHVQFHRFLWENFLFFKKGKFSREKKIVKSLVDKKSYATSVMSVNVKNLLFTYWFNVLGNK